MTLTSTSRLGVGTTNPLAQFVTSAAGASGFEVSPAFDMSGASAAGTVLLQTYNRSGSAYSTMDLSAAAFRFGIGGTVKASIDASGNVNVVGLTASKAVFTDSSKNLTTTGTLGVAQGGTALATLTAHAIYVGNGTSAPTAIAVGATGAYLRGATGADPGWSTLTLPNTVTVNRLLYASATNVVTDLATANSSILVTDGSGVPSLSTSLPAHTVTGALTLSAASAALLITNAQTPANSSEACTTGTVAWDASYVYVCTNSDTPWHRTAHATW
jgi:hypothetical protein